MNTSIVENYSDAILLEQVECIPMNGGYGLIAELMKRYSKIIAVRDGVEPMKSTELSESAFNPIADAELDAALDKVPVGPKLVQSDNKKGGSK